MMKSALKLVFFLLTALSFTECNTDEPAILNEVQPRDIFFDFKIWGEEGKDEVTCLLQFRYRRETGRTVRLDPPARVELDGELINADSAKITGPFYEIQKPISEFAGRHVITFTDINKKVYTEEFNFSPFSLQTEITDTIYRDDWTLDIAGLKDVDYLRIIAIDTSFYSDDINEIDTIRNGKLFITKEKLQTLVNGPVTLLFSKEEDRPVRNGTERGGKISITYGLKRDFVLTDTPNL